MKGNNNGLSVFLSLFIAVFLIAPFISSCGKTGSVSPSALNIQYQIINLSPDLGSVDLYIKYKKVNASSYFYPTASGYFYLTAIDTPLQIRPGASLISGTVVSTANLFNLDYILKPNLKYTLFITGFAKADSALFITDTAALPTIGRGKVRFLNASLNSLGLDVVANGTSAFLNQQYLKISPFKELPAGNYDFQIFPKNSRDTVLRDIQNVTIQDGRLYTIYTYGLPGRTDSLAFGSGVITNK
jgi:hypothetical protein